MTSAKEKLRAQSNQLPKDHVTLRSENDSTCFEIYDDDKNVKARGHLISNRTHIFVPAGGKAKSTGDNNTKENQKLKNRKSMHVKSKINLKRDALADVSNIQGPFSRKKLHDASKPMIPVGRVIKIDGFSSARKVFMGKSEVNVGEGVSNFPNPKQANTSGSKHYFVDQRAKAQHRASMKFGRVTGRDLSLGSRKSLPVLKTVDKENNTISEKDKEKCEDYAHQAIRVKPGNWRNCAGDGFVLKVPKPQTKADACALSRKTTRGKSLASISEDVSNLSNFKHGTKGTRTIFGDQRIKGQDRASINIDRMSTRNVSYRSRKSLPVLKKVDMENMNIPEIGKEKYDSSVHKVCNVKLRLRQHRASDDFKRMVPKPQTKPGACALSRKVKRPIRKISSNAAKTSTANSTLVSDALLPIPEISLKFKDGASTSTSLVPDGFVPTYGERAVEPPRIPNIVRRKSRRRSFTSSLVNGSKMLENAEKMQYELPAIDDASNHLEVSEYVDDIYQHYWIAEIHNPSLADIMKNQTEITPQMRGILINWLIEVHLKFELSQETLFLTVTLLDQYLLNVPIKNSELQLVGLTALFIASKYEDFWYPLVKDLISISVVCYTKDEFLKMEKEILNKLKFRLSSPTAYVFMLRFLKAAQANKMLKHLAFYLVELCLVESEALKFKPSLLSAAAVYLARLTLKISPPWTPLLSKHLRYDESQIRDCAGMILGFHKAAEFGKLNVSYKKFERAELSCVATLKPQRTIE